MEECEEGPVSHDMLVAPGRGCLKGIVRGTLPGGRGLLYVRDSAH